MATAYLGLALLAAAALAFEITLTRLFSVTQWYHFAFLAVSVALLGYGASGTTLSLVPRWATPPTCRRTTSLSLLFAAGILLAALSLNYLPFDSYRIAWERTQVLYLVIYYLALALPFFCAGLVTGLLLAAHPEATFRLYAANLLGSAFGSLAPILLLPQLGEGIILAIAVVGLAAALAFHWTSSGRLFKGLVLVSAALLLYLSWDLPPLFQLRLSPYKGLSQVLRFPDTYVTWQRWNAFSRVDHVAGPAIRSAPGLSLSYPGELPRQDALFSDGDDPSPVLLETEALADFTSYLPVALPYQLRPGARVLLLEPRGGLDLWVALSQGAASVVAVESNPLTVEAAGAVYQQPRVRVVTEQGRSYARRSTETYDLVHLALTDSYRPVTSGAYSLGERYDLTVEAFQDYLSRLQPDGLLLIERWLQMPPSETLRAGALAIEALRRTGVEDPGAQLVVLRSWQVSLILVKNSSFTHDELRRVRSFAQVQGLDLVALPGLTEAEANQSNLLPEPVYYRAFRQLLEDPAALLAVHAYDVRPPTDDRPFFFHFFRWTQARAVWDQMGKTWQPWGGSGYFVLVALLVVALFSSAVLILLPLAVRKRRREATDEPARRVVLYFGALGLGFLFVEIPLMQRFIQFLGQPIYAFASVVASLLFFSGLGSLAAPRLSGRRTLPLLVLVILLYPWVLPVLFRALQAAPLAVRLAMTGVSLSPLGFLMGIPFPTGLAWLHRRGPRLVPWAWAINGCVSVLASITAAMLAVSFGFSWVIVAAAVAYGVAWWAIR
jgi:hypothetical protein